MRQRLRTVRTSWLLERAAESLSTTEITNLPRRIAANLVTAPLIRTIRKELAEVGLDYRRVQVVSSGRAGVTTVRSAPPDKAFKRTDMAKVLSEGEQALMGLAAFFAELGMAGHAGPIVLGDAYSAPSRTPIPRQGEQSFRAKPNTDSTGRRTVIPRQGEQFRVSLWNVGSH
jgi:hypothetical protein